MKEPNKNVNVIRENRKKLNNYKKITSGLEKFQLKQLVKKMKRV